VNLPTDLLLPVQRAGVALAQIRSLELQRWETACAQAANHHDDADIAPGLAGPNGEVVRYADRYDQLDAAVRRVWDLCDADVKTALVALVDAQQAPQ